MDWLELFVIWCRKLREWFYKCWSEHEVLNIKLCINSNKNILCLKCFINSHYIKSFKGILVPLDSNWGDIWLIWAWNGPEPINSHPLAAVRVRVPAAEPASSSSSFLLPQDFCTGQISAQCPFHCFVFIFVALGILEWSSNVLKLWLKITLMKEAYLCLYLSCFDFKWKIHFCISQSTAALLGPSVPVVVPNHPSVALARFRPPLVRRTVSLAHQVNKILGLWRYQVQVLMLRTVGFK